ncbi:hypothetical protein BGZ54_010333 [Gamsiella multidivaricata]|nr:hypothetical protein BGZ54_010333 [Gamsiella multidivaricata]
MSMNANIMPVFEQLGLLEEIKKISKPCESIKLHDIHMKELVEFAMSSYQDLTGYQPVVFARPRLYNLLISQIPSHKILRGKKVLSFEENEDHVLISCSDNSQYRGDILVGADGAYSGVRQCLFKKLEREGSLPRSDTQGMTIGYVCTVGTTESIDPEKYPCLRDNATRFSQVLGKDLFNYTTATVPDNQICWALVMQHKKEGEGKELAFRNSEWAPESVETSLKDFYNFPCPFGGSMKDIIDATPKECISKVFLEEKIMETWYHGRVVLIGDACHKVL